jgi:hypothetical protein
MVYFIDNASPPHHNPRPQVPIPNNQLSYGYLASQSPGQHFYAQSGDIHQMPAAQFAFMNNQMAHMMQKMDSVFSEDNEEQNIFEPEMYNDDTSEGHISVTTRSQSLSASLNRLTIEEHVSSSRSVLTHGSSSTTVRADQRPRHIIIPGDHTEVDNNFYESNFDSHKVENNIIGNSFREVE